MGKESFLCKAFLSSESCLLNYPPPRSPSPHNHFHFRKEIVKKTPTLQGLGGGGSLVLYSGCIPGGLEGLDILAALEWSRRSGSLGRRGGQTGGVFLRSFPFLASPRARAQSSLWSGDCGREVETLHPTGWPEAGGSGRTSPEKPCPGSFAKRRQRCSRGRCSAGARETRHPPSPSRLPLAQAPRADRAAVRARRAPRSVQLFFFRGPELGRGDAGGPFGREERRAWSVVARRLHLLHQGWHHLPEGVRRRGRFSWSGCAPGTLGVWETDPKRLSLPRRASDF